MCPARYSLLPGRGTAEALAGRFLQADVSTAAYLTDAVAAALLHRGVAGRRLLLVRAHDTHGALADRVCATYGCPHHPHLLAPPSAQPKKATSKKAA